MIWAVHNQNVQDMNWCSLTIFCLILVASAEISCDKGHRKTVSNWLYVCDNLFYKSYSEQLKHK